MRRLHLLVLLVLALSDVEGLASSEVKGSVLIARGDAQTPETTLAGALEAELDRFPARTGLYLKHLKTGEEAAVRADESFNSQLGDISARETARMIEGIERETIASPASCRTMRTFMRRQLAGSRRLPHFLNVPVAHKTGDSGNIANDVGIIYARSGPIVIAFLVNGVTGSLGEAEDRMGRIARLLVDHFDGGNSR